MLFQLHFVSHRTWIVFSFNGILPSSLLATNITSFYCMLYASWLGFVLVNYLYRYMALCRYSFNFSRTPTSGMVGSIS